MRRRRKGGWKQLTLPGVGNALKFIPCPQASSEGGKSVLQHELVPFIIIIIITLAYLGASGGENLTQQAEQDSWPPGLWGFHLHSQQVSGCIHPIAAGRICPGCALLVSEEPAAPKNLLETACPPKPQGLRVHVDMQRGDGTQRHPQCQPRGQGCRWESRATHPHSQRAPGEVFGVQK